MTDSEYRQVLIDNGVLIPARHKFARATLRLDVAGHAAALRDCMEGDWGRIEMPWPFGRQRKAEEVAS